MKTIKNFSIFLLSVSTIFYTSCTDDKPIVGEDSHVTFDFSSPLPGAQYENGDTVFINGMISHALELHGYEVSVINTSKNDTVVFNNHEHLDTKMFHIHEHWVNNVSSRSNVKLRIEAFTDHSGASEVKEILFHCHPM